MLRRVSVIALALLLSVVPAASARPEDELRAAFARFMTAQNSRDLGATRDLLWESPGFLWIARGVPLWGREAALRRFEAAYQGTWRLEPSLIELQVTMLSDGVGQVYVPVLFTWGMAGESPQSIRLLMSQTMVRTATGWKVASIVPVPILVQAAATPAPIAAIDR